MIKTRQRERAIHVSRHKGVYMCVRMRSSRKERVCIESFKVHLCYAIEVLLFAITCSL